MFFKHQNIFDGSILKSLESDFHWSIIGHISSEKKNKSSFPSAKYIQLRHIEVPLSGIEDYLKWRENTIFKYVKNNEHVKTFEVYHSLVSCTPGVQFISEVDGNLDSYLKSFETEEYKKIIKDAGESHIKNELSTPLYKKVL
ncbi:MAG: hypothetical protein ACK5NF_00895 [Bacilli bacterium]